MEEAKSMAQRQQQQQLLQQQQQQQQQQQLYLMQQFQQRQQQQAAMARFPSNIDAHLRPLGILTPNRPLNPNPNPNPNPNSNFYHSQPQNPSSSPQSQLHKVNRGPATATAQAPPQAAAPAPLGGNKAELQMAYQDAWRVCHPDFKRPFSSLEDACERLLPYHVVADYEAEEDDRIFESDTTGQILSRSQQWDHNIAAKVAEFTSTFEKQALAFNIITRKRALGEFRSEERLMIEQALLQEEKRAVMEVRAEMESRANREAHEAKLRMAAEQARSESQAHDELMVQGPIRASALGSQGNDGSMSHEMVDQEQGVNPDEIISGWGSNAQRGEREPSDDFLNDEEGENGEADGQDELRESAEFDLNSSR